MRLKISTLLEFGDLYHFDVRSLFIAGRSDWGTYQSPGNFERMQATACTHRLGCHLIDGAGHWVRQGQPDRVSELVVRFIADQAAPR